MAFDSLKEQICVISFVILAASEVFNLHRSSTERKSVLEQETEELRSLLSNSNMKVKVIGVAFEFLLF